MISVSNHGSNKQMLLTVLLQVMYMYVSNLKEIQSLIKQVQVILRSAELKHSVLQSNI